MNTAKAIQLNKESEKSLRGGKFHDFADAVKLGNEALKRHQKQQANQAYPEAHLLPGETKV